MLNPLPKACVDHLLPIGGCLACGVDAIAARLEELAFAQLALETVQRDGDAVVVDLAREVICLGVHIAELRAMVAPGRPAPLPPKPKVVDPGPPPGEMWHKFDPHLLGAAVLCAEGSQEAERAIATAFRRIAELPAAERNALRMAAKRVRAEAAYGCRPERAHVILAWLSRYVNDAGQPHFTRLTYETCTRWLARWHAAYIADDGQLIRDVVRLLEGRDGRAYVYGIDVTEDVKSIKVEKAAT